MRKLILLCIILFSFSQSKAQSQKVLNSKWVKIMQDESSASFLEAENDFKKYYASYLKKKIRSKDERHAESPGEEHLESPEEKLIARYQRWAMVMRPFVNADGSLKPIEERVAIMNAARQQQEVK